MHLIPEGLKMTKLVVKLSGKAEERFQELLNETGVSGKDVVLDALALLHFAVMETIGGRKIAAFNPKTKEARPFSLPSLNIVESKSKA